MNQQAFSLGHLGLDSGGLNAQQIAEAPYQSAQLFICKRSARRHVNAGERNPHAFTDSARRASI